MAPAITVLHIPHITAVMLLPIAHMDMVLPIMGDIVDTDMVLQLMVVMVMEDMVPIADTVVMVDTDMVLQLMVVMEDMVAIAGMALQVDTALRVVANILPDVDGAILILRLIIIFFLW
jgi:hypothetical protein